MPWQVALGFAEFLPSKAHGYEVRMAALDRAQQAALSLASDELTTLLSQDQGGPLARAVRARDPAAAMVAWYATPSVETACRAFAAWVNVAELLPSRTELQALDAPAGGVTHELRGTLYAKRIRLALLHLPRHAMDLCILHRCEAAPDRAVRFRAAHPSHRSTYLWGARMARATWARDGLPWTGGDVRQRTAAAVVGLARVTKQG